MKKTLRIITGLAFFAIVCLCIYRFLFVRNAKSNHIHFANDSSSNYVYSASDTKLVCIHFADNTAGTIPTFVLTGIFSILPDYLSSSTAIAIKAQKSPVYLDNFMVEYSSGEFFTFLHSLRHLHLQVVKSFEIVKVSNDDCQTIFEKNFNLFSSLEITLTDFKRLLPILQKCARNEKLAFWLSNNVKVLRPTSFYSYKVLQKWSSAYQFALPVVFLNDLRFENNGKQMSISISDLEQKDHPCRVSSGTYYYCLQVNFQCSFQQKDGINNLLLKLFEGEDVAENTVKHHLQEYFIFKKNPTNYLVQYKRTSSLVVKSSSDCTPVGYLMEKAEYGDLVTFLNEHPDTVLIKYFTEQLFELAKVINSFHNYNTFHFNIRADNIFVRQRLMKGSYNHKEKYEFILGDFGFSETRKFPSKNTESVENMVRVYSPEFFRTFSDGIPSGSCSDWYEYGRVLNFIAADIGDPVKKRKFVFIFSVLMNNISVLNPKKRWGFPVIENFFSDLLSNYSENRVLMPYLWNDKNQVPNWFHTSINIEKNPQCFSYVSEYKSCRFEYYHFNWNVAMKNNGIPGYIPGLTKEMTIPIIYEFQRDYPFAISLPQSHNEKMYFFKGSFLIFHPNFFLYAEIYDSNDENMVLFSVATYNYLELVNKINSGEIEYIKEIKSSS